MKVKFPCPLCKKPKPINTILKHVKKHKGENVQNGGCASCMIGGSVELYPCPLCKKESSLNKIINHLKTHKGQKSNSVSCSHCKQKGGCGCGCKGECKCKNCGCKQVGGGTKQFYGKKSSTMVKVPTNVKKTAEYSFKLRKYGFKGGRDTGIKRAKQLATKEYIPIEDLKYMRAWFARHIYASYPSYRLWQKAGRPKNDPKWHNKHGIYSWVIWSGDSGFKWVNSSKSIKLLNKHYPGKNYKKI